jgi:hypothetical protein
MLARALERSAWRVGAVAGIFGGLLALGRGQVALIFLYVLVGFVVAHWVGGENLAKRVRASINPLAAGCITGALVAAPHGRSDRSCGYCLRGSSAGLT